MPSLLRGERTNIRFLVLKISRRVCLFKGKSTHCKIFMKSTMTNCYRAPSEGAGSQDNLPCWSWEGSHVKAPTFYPFSFTFLAHFHLSVSFNSFNLMQGYIYRQLALLVLGKFPRKSSSFLSLSLFSFLVTFQPPVSLNIMHHLISTCLAGPGQVPT